MWLGLIKQKSNFSGDSWVFLGYSNFTDFPGGSVVKNLPPKEGMSQEDPLEEEMATPSSILAWRIPWTEDSGGLQSMGLQRVRHD